MIHPDAVPESGACWPWPRWDEVEGPLVLGVAGAQGSGKSTLAAVLAAVLAGAGARVVAASKEHFYLTRDARARSAAQVHPLLATRGVPGTHDVALLKRVLTARGGHDPVALPVFDKGTDDPLPVDRWRRVAAPVDVFVLEGWCVGAAPEPDAALATPLNELEAQEDPRGEWRRWVNAQLAGPYKALWAHLHGLVFLQVPDFDAVRRWRAQQEQALPAARRMGAGELARFIAHYQRLTAAMLRDLPARAEVVARLGPDHRLAELRRNPRM
jgi:D-glycerate 3-kinase